MSINSLDIYFFVCLFICFFKFSLPSRCCRKEQEILVIMNISWKENYYENDHDYYEHLLEGNITLTMCKFSFHFPSNLLGIMKFGWDGWVAKALKKKCVFIVQKIKLHILCYIKKKRM